MKDIKESWRSNFRAFLKGEEPPKEEPKKDNICKEFDKVIRLMDKFALQKGEDLYISGAELLLTLQDELPKCKNQVAHILNVISRALTYFKSRIRYGNEEEKQRYTEMANYAIEIFNIDVVSKMWESLTDTKAPKSIEEFEKKEYDTSTYVTENRKWWWYINEQTEAKKTVIIIPGGFKPPHKGHVMMINHYLKNYPDADIVVYSGSKTRKGGAMDFGKDVALQIFDIYKNAGVFVDSSRLRFNFDLTQRTKKGGGSWESPFRDAIELAQSGEVAVGIGYSEKDSAYGVRFDKAGGENAFDPGPAPSFENMSATDFRNAIANNNQEQIVKFLPDGVDVQSFMELFMMEEDLRKWFGRKGEPGKKGGWVDCNAPKYKDGKKVGYKACGRGSGEKRSKYPACRPTASACKSKGKGKKWGKKS